MAHTFYDNANKNIDIKTTQYNKMEKNLQEYH